MTAFAPPVFLALLERKSPPRVDTLSPRSSLNVCCSFSHHLPTHKSPLSALSSRGHI